MLAVEQARPQPPQCAALVCTSAQVPAQHVVEAPHAVSQLPQCPSSVCRSTQLPPQQDCVPGQAWVALHPGTQVPSVQTWPAGQL
jgi:hypothetical protein